MITEFDMSVRQCNGQELLLCRWMPKRSRDAECGRSPGGQLHVNPWQILHRPSNGGRQHAIFMVTRNRRCQNDTDTQPALHRFTRHNQRQSKLNIQTTSPVKEHTDEDNCVRNEYWEQQTSPKTRQSKTQARAHTKKTDTPTERNATTCAHTFQIKRQKPHKCAQESKSAD